jgi:hypothetical protein
LYSITEFLVSIREYIDQHQNMAPDGHWKKLWPKPVDDLLWFGNQQDEIRKIFMLAHKIPGE